MSIARLGRGLVVRRPATRPELTLELFEFESCPYCRKVRETLTELDLDYVSRSAAKGSLGRDEAVKLGGTARFPLLRDPNNGRHLYESEDIIDYLHATYGKGERARWKRYLAPVNTAGSTLASGIRNRGGKVVAGARGRPLPAERLELWNFEASPFCRKVREELSSLGLETVVHNVGKRSPQRPGLVAAGGKMQVPYLADPNTGVAMYESDDIIAYLRATYG